MLPEASPGQAVPPRVLAVLHTVLTRDVQPDLCLNDLNTTLALLPPNAEGLLLCDLAPCPTQHASRDQADVDRVRAALAAAGPRLHALLRPRAWQPEQHMFAGAAGKRGALSLLQSLLSTGTPAVPPVYLDSEDALRPGRYDAVLVLSDDTALCPDAPDKLLQALLDPEHPLRQVMPRLYPDAAGLIAPVCFLPRPDAAPPLLCRPDALLDSKPRTVPGAAALIRPRTALREVVAAWFSAPKGLRPCLVLAAVLLGCLFHSPWVLLAALLSCGLRRASSPLPWLVQSAADLVLLPAQTAARLRRPGRRATREPDPAALRRTVLRWQALSALACLGLGMRGGAWLPALAPAACFLIYPALPPLLERPFPKRHTLPDRLRSPLADLARASGRCLTLCLDHSPLPAAQVRLTPAPAPIPHAEPESVALTLLGLIAACELGVIRDWVLIRRLTRLADTISALLPEGRTAAGCDAITLVPDDAPASPDHAALLYLALRIAAKAASAEPLLAQRLLDLSAQVCFSPDAAPLTVLAAVMQGSLPPSELPPAFSSAAPEDALLAALLVAPTPRTAYARCVRRAAGQTLASSPTPKDAVLCLPHAPRAAMRLLTRARLSGQMTPLGFPSDAGRTLLLRDQALLLCAAAALASDAPLSALLHADPAAACLRGLRLPEK